MSQPTVQERVARAAAAIDGYREPGKPLDYITFTDALADLVHLARVRGFDITDCWDLALMHAEAEADEEAAGE